MKSDIAAASFLILFLLIFAFYSTSCSSNVISDPFDYTDEDFDVEISGTVDEQSVRAKLSVRPNAGEEECSICLCFIYPEHLNGITVTLYSDGKSEARLGSSVYSGIDFEGLVAPFLSLCEGKEISSVKKYGDRNEVRVCDESCDLNYVFLHDFKIPVSVKGEYSGRIIDLKLSMSLVSSNRKQNEK